MRSVDEIGDELYASPPTMFTAARDAAVAQARADGDPTAARNLAAMKRPTQGAFLVNVLALRRPDVVSELIDLGERIRTAQGTMTSAPPTPRPPNFAAELRGLTSQRRTAIGAALATCRSLATEVGAGEPTASQVAEAEATLAAAMADADAADLVRTGRVVKALSYAGFGAGFGTTAPVKAPGAAARRAAGGPARPAEGPARPQPEAVRTHAQPVDTETEERERQRREEERAAWERLARAEAGLASAQAHERAANDEMDRIADEITRLRGALDAASQRARTARTARQTAERELATARRTVGQTG